MSDEVVVKIAKSLDADTAEKMLTELTRVVSAGPSRLICDLSETDYISSIGVGVLMSIYKRLKNLGGVVVLASMKPRVKAVFETAGLLAIFSVKE